MNNKFLEFDNVLKMLQFCDDLCKDCVFEGSACFGCHIYYDRKNYMKDLRMFVDEVFLNE